MKLDAETVDIISEGGDDTYKTIEEGQWISDGKYESKRGTSVKSH